MAYWGVALALGPNINLDVDPDREKAAYNAVQQARKTPPMLPRTSALTSKRYRDSYSLADKADLHQLASDYSRAMGSLLRATPTIWTLRCSMPRA